MTDTNAFVLMVLGLKDGQGERAALRGAGVRTFIKVRSNHDGQNAYIIPEAEFNENSEAVKDMLATLGVTGVWHVSGDHRVSRGVRASDYAATTPVEARVGLWGQMPDSPPQETYTIRPGVCMGIMHRLPDGTLRPW